MSRGDLVFGLPLRECVYFVDICKVKSNSRRLAGASFGNERMQSVLTSAHSNHIDTLFDQTLCKLKPYPAGCPNDQDFLVRKGHWLWPLSEYHYCPGKEKGKQKVAEMSGSCAELSKSATQGQFK